MTTIPETPLGRARVSDAMHTGILTTDPQTPLRVVARLMADRSVHAVAVADQGYSRRPWAIVSAIDVAAAVASGAELTAGEAARTDIVTVRSDDRLEDAARLMAERGVDHLIVVNPGSGHVDGILSTLDIAAVYGA
jgi:CBS domain-containing protein